MEPSACIIFLVRQYRIFSGLCSGVAVIEVLQAFTVLALNATDNQLIQDLCTC